MKKRIIYILSIVLLHVFSFLNAQETKAPERNPLIDSLLTSLKTVTDTIQINTLNLLSRQYINMGDYKKSIQYAQSALKYAENLSYKSGIASSLNNIGIIFCNQGNYEMALISYLKSLKIREEIKDKIGTANSYCNIGIIYFLQRNYEKSLDNTYKSLIIREKIGDKQGVASSYNNIGLVYLNQKNYNKALDNYLKSLKILEAGEDKYAISVSYNNIGNIYKLQKKYKKALDIHLKGLKTSEEINDKQGIAFSYFNIGSLYIELGKFEDSYKFLRQALSIDKEIGNNDAVKEEYSALSELYSKKGDYKRAFEYHKMYSDIKDSLLNEQSNKQIAEMSTKYESEKKERDIELLTKDKSLQQAEIGKQKLIRNGSIGGLMLALLLAFVLFNRFKVTSKQKKVIESQNFLIVESINYAKKIQNSLLPSLEIMQKALSNLFVFYEPKAIVSGDFYFFKEFDQYVLIACVDCTGHGVPGGFMSTLGSLLLDKISNNNDLSPSEILNKLNSEIIRILHQQNGGEIQDGMDLSICLIDRINKKVEFSGARNGIIVVSNNEAKRYKADSLPVGGNYMKKGIAVERDFKTQSISINSTDWIYMYTDGFMEQVGGTEGIPMNYTQFENQLVSLSEKHTSDEKCKLLQVEMDKWRGINERDDDVLIVGFQII